MLDSDWILERVKKIKGARQLGTINTPDKDYPFYMIKAGQGEKIMLSGGVHGDEPSGVWTVLAFMEQYAADYLDKFEFTAFPCVNPWGLEHNTRENHQKLNLNREFKPDTKSQETKLLIEAYENYLFIMDFHETWPSSSRVGDKEPDGADPHEFFLWETCENKSLRVGHEIVEQIERAGLPVCKWQNIYDDINNNGVIWYPENCRTECYEGTIHFDSYLYAHHTEQAFVIEVPQLWKPAARIRAHLISLLTVLNAKLRDL